jgi:hypothetical protein
VNSAQRMLITSNGAHGVPGSAIVILAATLNAVPGTPAIGLVLVLSVDWFIGMARALGNLIGNCVATVVVVAWEGDLDRDKAHSGWHGGGRGDRGLGRAAHKLIAQADDRFDAHCGLPLDIARRPKCANRRHTGKKKGFSECKLVHIQPSSDRSIP